MDLTFYDDILKKHGWDLEHQFSDEGRFYVHPEIEGEILVQPEGQWTHTLFDFAKEKKFGHGYNAKDLEKYLSSGEKTEKRRKSKSERLINLIEMIEIQEDYTKRNLKLKKLLRKFQKDYKFGTEIAPYLLDAFEKGADVGTKEKAVQYLEDLAERDKHAIPSLDYLKTLDDEEYIELWNFVKKE